MKVAALLLFGLMAGLKAPGVRQISEKAAQTPAPQVSAAPQPDVTGAYRVGNGVSSPKLVFQVEPEFSEKARKLKIAGKCVMSALVGTSGLVQEVVTTQSLADKVPKKSREAALSLDEEARRAVGRYRFEPAMYQGKAVPVRVVIDVDFQIF